MKHNKFRSSFLSLTAILSLMGGLTSCNEENKSDSSDIPSSDTSSDSGKTPSSDISPDSGSSDIVPASGWDDKAKRLMDTFCGGVLPYSPQLFSENTTVNKVYSSSYGGYYLEISDKSDTFSIINYYEDLEDAGWNVIRTYNGNAVQTDEAGFQIVEATNASADKTIGYDLVYFWANDGENNYNVIRCYNDMYATVSEQTAWGKDAQETIYETLETEIPFLDVCSNPLISRQGLNTLYVVDYYYKDLSANYAEVLKKNGFVLDEKLSKENDIYVLTKTLDNGVKIDATLYFYNGNIFYFSYTPNYTEYSTWPTEFVKEIKDKSGVEIPKFEIADGGVYKTYIKHGVYYFYTEDLSDTFDYEMYVYDDLTYFGLTWEEKLSISPYLILDEDQENLYAFMLSAAVSTPVSTFVDAWPEDVVESTIKNVLGIDNINVPVLDSSNLSYPEKKVKYRIYGEEYYKEYYEYYYNLIASDPSAYGLEDASPIMWRLLAESLAKKEQGIAIYIYDNNLKAATAYAKSLYELGWYETVDDDWNAVWEDPTGTIAITFTGEAQPTHDYDGQTMILIRPGSGKAHTPVLEFEKSEVIVGIGIDNQLTLNKNMLPYDITYSSSDTTNKITVNNDGVVSVASDTVEGTTATITASCTIPSGEEIIATCVVTAQKVDYYTPLSALQTIAGILESKGYTSTITEAKKEDDMWISFDTLKSNLGSAFDENSLKAFVESELIPQGFQKAEDSDWEETEISVSKTKTANGWVVTYRIANDFCIMALEMRVYVYNGNAYLEVEAY